MQRLATTWIKTQLAKPVLVHDGGVLQFSWRLAFRAIVIANVMVVLAHVMLAQLDLLPYPLADALLIGLSVSTLTAGAVTLVFGYYIGKAIEALSISRDEFARLSATDMLSGLLNRRSLFDIFETVGPGASFVIFDIDRFKAINDSFGHEVGDRVIREVGRLLAETFGPMALAVARIGGEEFAVLLTADTASRHAVLVEAARAKIAATVIDLDDRDLRVTISAGIADVTHNFSALAIYKAADRALYVAKAAGRNRIVHARSLTDARFAAQAPIQTELALAS